MRKNEDVYLAAELEYQNSKGNVTFTELGKKYGISKGVLSKRVREKGLRKGSLKLERNKSLVETLQDSVVQQGTVGVIPQTLDKMLKASSKCPKCGGRVPDWKARDKAISQIANIMDLYASKKVDVRSKSVHVDMTKDLIDVLLDLIPDSKRAEAAQAVEDVFNKYKM